MPRIEDYALIGDLQTAALVSREGSVDWACFPRFDSNACFAALVGDEHNGRWLIAPCGEIKRSSRKYREDTLILETLLETAEGAVRLIDFMPPRGEAPDIVRIVEGVRGRVAVQCELIIRFDFGLVVPWVRRMDHMRLAIAGPDALRIDTPVDLRGENLTTVAEFTVAEGDRVPFVLTWFPSHQDPPDAVDPEQALEDAEDYWREWASRCDHTGRYHDDVHASLLVLKALTYKPTGGIVAAPTSSLPEKLGGVRNWDYRFCWLRDATLTILAMLNAGYKEEAVQWRDWLLRAIAGDPSEVQTVYGLAGERRLDERELDWLPGYEGSKPVRIGNAACGQLQLDVYGEVIEAFYQARRHGAPPDDNIWSLAKIVLDWLEGGWRQEDSGIWEVRGPRQHFTHSKVMAWVAFDRAVRHVEELGRDGPVDRWRAAMEEIRADVLTKAYDAERGTFVQAYGSSSLDATALLIPLVGFLPADDERMLRTVDTIQKELTIEGFVRRYPEEGASLLDGFPDGEGVFLPCSFWLADVLALQGRDEEAEALFDRLLGIRNDVGLLAEEYDPVGKRQLGNFPQAFTHLALVNTAFILEEGRGMREGK